MAETAVWPEVVVDAEGRVDEDRICIECGYSLRGLPTVGVCPECGKAIEESLRLALLRQGDPWWLRRMAVGARLAFHGAVWLTVLPFALSLVGFVLASMSHLLPVDDFDGEWMGVGAIAAVTSLAGMVLIGLWLIGGADPAYRRMGRAVGRAHGVARLAVVAAGVLWIATYSVSLHFSVGYLVPMGAVIASLVAWSACGLVLSGLAMRLPDFDLSRSMGRVARLAGWLAGCAGLFFGTLIVLDAIGVMDDHTLWQSLGIEVVLSILGSVLVIWWFVLNVRYLMMLGRFVKAVRPIAGHVASAPAGGEELREQDVQADSSWREEVHGGLQWVIVGLLASLLIGVGWQGVFANVRWDAYGYGDPRRIVWESLKTLQVLAGLVAVCGVLRAMSRPWIGSRLRGRGNQLRRIGRGAVAVGAVLEIVWVFDLFREAVQTNIFLVVVVLSAAGGCVWGVYLLGMAGRLVREPVRWLRLAVCGSIIAEMMWYFAERVMLAGAEFFVHTRGVGFVLLFLSHSSRLWLWSALCIMQVIPPVLVWRAMRRQRGPMASGCPTAG